MKRVITSSVERKVSVTSNVEIPDWYQTDFAQTIVDKYCKGLPLNISDEEAQYLEEPFYALGPDEPEMTGDHVDDIIRFYTETGIEPSDVTEYERWV